MKSKTSKAAGKASLDPLVRKNSSRMKRIVIQYVSHPLATREGPPRMAQIRGW
jgi:hypothetical protein